MFKNRVNARRGATVVACGALLLASGCSDGSSEASENDSKSQGVTIALPDPSCLAFSSLYVADAQGFFADEGISVTPLVMDGSSAILQAMSSGHAEIGNVAPDSLIAAADAGQENLAFYNFFPRNTQGIWVPSDSPIASLEDLGDQPLGVDEVAGLEAGFGREVMTEYDLPAPNLVSVGVGSTALASLKRGDVVGLIAAATEIAKLESVGEDEFTNLVPSDYETQFANAMTATADLASSSPEVMEGVGRALARGEVWAAANREETIDVCSEINPEEVQDRDFALTLRDALTPTLVPQEGNMWGYFPPEGWEAFADSMVKSGEIDAAPDLEALYTNEYAESYDEAAKAEAESSE